MKKIIFIGIVTILLTFSGCKGTKCYDDCYKKDVDCSHDDNNCVNGGHYCYDMCYGGATLSGLPKL